MKRSTLINLAVAAVSGLLTFVVVIVIGRVVGFQFQVPRPEAELIFPPHSIHTHVTSELDTVITTNNLGFRDEDMGEKDPGVYRILAIGDSFTYGWGVQNEEAWPEVLESLLRDAGYRVEVANLGAPGAHPDKYTGIAAKAIPVLQPDLVILGVLQGDDLSQSTRRSEPINPDVESAPESDGGSGMNTLLSTLNVLLGATTEFEAVTDISDLHKVKYDEMMKDASDAERAQLDALDPGVAEALHTGGLNPALVNRAMEAPRCLIEASDPELATFDEYLDNMTWEFEQIKRIADRYGAKVHVVSVPLGIYVSERSYKSRERIGFELDPEMLNSDVGDAPIQAASERAMLPFGDATKEFRELCREEVLFYEYDGHFNTAGQRRFAEAVLPMIEAYLEK